MKNSFVKIAASVVLASVATFGFAGCANNDPEPQIDNVKISEFQQKVKKLHHKKQVEEARTKVKEAKAAEAFKEMKIVFKSHNG